ncbi:GCD14/PCMT domain-containing protein [Histoplasma capsulatum var. duboisii H88]|uniref:tRNA (adenine(58)-N(1))-methyltransferase catalytic subunit TRM61 n=2 Tax=Ajellomyces capsulatus (strain H88) TaxID=544711 RepID=A0A8A1LJZ9_AJEC8|nr:GCD14/PCMT domain-containing protein [Histoplasma capsulatum var. duboisii H88]
MQDKTADLNCIFHFYLRNRYFGSSSIPSDSTSMPSPFLTPGPTAKADSLAVLHLRRNLLIPTVLKTHDDENLGYDEGKVTNTRFGSFPHSTLIGQPWGSQIVASKVDTGSRGRKLSQKQPSSLKRKADEMDTSEANDDDSIPPTPRTAVAASSGFIHLLPPTPESWTASLPHRTQVVYTPDYSYILHRIRARPGCRLIEAGAGSGSFTHAAARAVFNGYPSPAEPPSNRHLGKVYSFEFHAQRASKIREEIRDHGLDGIVDVSYRDVYNEGFLVGEPLKGESPRANAIFLDLPAPWLALKHLVREPTDGSPSPLDPSVPVHICTFSPCLEQVQRTISALRQHDWVSISMVEVNHRQIEVRRERYGIEGGGGRGTIPGPRNVEESVTRLRDIGERGKAFHASQAQSEVESAQATTSKNETENDNCKGGDGDGKRESSKEGTEIVDPEGSDKNDPSSSVISGILKLKQSTPSVQPLVPAYKQGNLIHRSEPDLKTHTSYLVFAILPITWSEEEEQQCREKWPSVAKSRAVDGASVHPKSKKQMKREEKAERKTAKKAEEEQF